jgi:hypothetical protein
VTGTDPIGCVLAAGSFRLRVKTRLSFLVVSALQLLAHQDSSGSAGLWSTESAAIVAASAFLSKDRWSSDYQAATARAHHSGDMWNVSIPRDETGCDGFASGRTEAIPGTVMDEAAWLTSFAAAGLRRPLIRTLGGCMAGGTL